ncbi:MAG: hypothetical protein KC438_07040, partial [Thermomicrobiales bacterium]|nr:hypothetical protein [Thermomicrobiales bacterium]
MKTRIVALLGFVLAFGLVAPYAGNTTVAQAPADCAGVAEYLEAYHQVGQNYQAAIDRVDSSQVEDWTEADFTMVLTALDTAIAEVNALQTPDILVPLEEKALESLQSIKEMMTAVQTGDLMAAAPFIEQVNAATDELNAVAVPIEEHCQVAIIDNDNDGTPEIGLGTSGTPVSPALDPTAELGSYANPYPIGTAQATENNWTIQVDAVTPDGTELVLAENSFNTPPEEGRQFFIATITAT